MNLRSYLSEELAFADNTMNWLQHRLMFKYFIRGPIHSLVIGAAGSTEVYHLRKLGNFVQAVEHDPVSKHGIEQRLSRHGLNNNINVYVGGIEDFHSNRHFHFLLMSHVLEHISDDAAVLNKLAQFSSPHARLMVATPTSLNGLPSKDTYVDPIPRGPNHVRPGYQGPELDIICGKAGFILIKRFYVGNPLLQYIWNLEFSLNQRSRSKQLLFFIFRPFILFLSNWKHASYNQISIYTKLP